MEMKKKERLAALGIIVCTLMWGAGFPALKATEDLPAFLIIAIRFIIAAIFLSAVFHRRFRLLNRTVVKNAFILSFLIFIMYVFATVGIRYTTSSKASFFSCLGFVIIPFLNWMIYKQKISKITVASVAMCLAGIFLLSYSSDMGLSFALGDIICIGGSLAGSLQIVFLDRMTKDERNDPTLLSVLMMIFIAVYGSIAAVFTGAWQVRPAGFDWCVLIFIGLFCTAIAYLLQAVGQKYVPSTRVGIMCALEPASGAIFSAVLLGEQLGLFGWAGGAVIIASLVFMEVMSARTAPAESGEKEEGRSA
ncbi:DMT family transporter [Anaerovorax odorimutans]|uniref:DMT family transporter n=1 Tax=Anaerovorax odorimutans TaxID=109327 RepID=A0ABT1RLD4_9FIRM|nr:EamA family transporter [Anaerovorax odorimutans]MCQ4635756.1 DMT family transporter [Anaerovorax odorimutans]